MSLDVFSLLEESPTPPSVQVAPVIPRPSTMDQLARSTQDLQTWGVDYQGTQYGVVYTIQEVRRVEIIVAVTADSVEEARKTATAKLQTKMSICESAKIMGVDEKDWETTQFAMLTQGSVAELDLILEEHGQEAADYTVQAPSLRERALLAKMAKEAPWLPL